MSQENVEIVRRLFDFIELLGGRIEPDELASQLSDAALGEIFDPDLELVPTPQGMLAGASYQGYEGIRRFAADFFAAWEEFRIEPQEFREVGDRVVALLRVRGRMHELELDEAWSGLYKLRNGRVLRMQTFTSRGGALEAAGLRE
jgi:ketosteroid isomerase-like protein